MTTSIPAVRGRILLSYRQEETAGYAGWLYDRLVNHLGEGRVVKDIIDAIRPGEDLVEVVTATVRSCDLVLVLIGDRWLTITDAADRRRLDDPGDVVRLEIEAALTLNVRVIPILLENAQIPRADRLPTGLTKLAKRQALMLSLSHFESDTRRLLRLLDHSVGAESGSTQPSFSKGAAMSASEGPSGPEATEDREIPNDRGHQDSARPQQISAAASGHASGRTLSIPASSEPGRETSSRKIKLFISYSHRDERHLKGLAIHLAALRRQGAITDWHDRMILPGEEWRQVIGDNLDTADCVLFLVTPDFIASDYCYSTEMDRALQKHREGRLLAVPIIVRPADWQHTPLNELQVLPRDGKPIVEWAVRDRAWLDVTEGLRLGLARFIRESE